MLDLDVLLKAELDKYAFEVKESVDQLAKEVAEEAVKELKEGSPKRRPKYAKGWKVKESKVGINNMYTVYNALLPGLTHILEKGYPTRSGGRYPAQVHIKPAEENAIKKFESGIKEVVK